MKNRILFFGPYPPPYGGVAIYMKNLFDLMADCEADYRFLVFSKEAINKKKVVRLAPKPWYIFQWIVHFFSVKTCLDSNEFNFEYPNWKLAAFWLILKKIYGFKWIKVIHDGSLPERFKSFNSTQKSTFFRMLPMVDEMIVVNEKLNDWFKDNIGYKKNIHVVGSLLPNNNNLEKGVVLDENIIRFFEIHDKTILSIGVFDPTYGFHDIADTIEKIRNQDKQNLGLILIDGAFINNPEYERMVLENRDWILKLSQINNVMVRKIIEHCDIFIRAFKYESYGLSRIEALMCNKPVIATNVGETRGMLLYEYGDTNKLKELLEICLYSLSQTKDEHWSLFFQNLATENWSKLYQLIQ